MIRSLKPVSLFLITKRLLFVVILTWAVVASVLAFRNQTHVLLVGIDPYGVRLITSNDDRLLRIEKENFVKRFLVYLYTYSGTEFEKRISLAGDMMALKLWEEKTPEFKSIAAKLPGQELSQAGTLKELRSVDAETFEADLELLTKNRLQEARTKVRVELKIRAVSRTAQNPYAYEVESYVERVL